ncbi:NAD(P)/FAD-dependent oxidoreductase [Chitinophaga lutea]|nr:FAD-binding oxidoreductase [Chitinophaga lutea]
MANRYDYIIVGQGISGTLLSWELHQAGQRVLVYDDARPHTASRTAAGIINPVSGRRFELAWLYDTIFPEAQGTYRALEAALGIACFHPRDIWSVWPSAQMRDAFGEAAGNGQAAPYMEQPSSARHGNELLQPFGAGIVKGANVQLGALLPAWRAALQSREQLREERFDVRALELLPDGVAYKGLQAKAVIFCEGVESPANPYFGGLKFLPNKGEALVVEVPGFETPDIIKKSITLVPLEGCTYWAGASFSWDYPDAAPTETARASLESSLLELLKVPFSVKGHIAAVRPSGMDRRPFVGMHPKYPQVGIFNGMGSKGCSLAPWAAAQFRRQLLEGAPMRPEIDIKRYFNALR